MARTSRPIRVPMRKSARSTSESFRRLFSVSAGVFVFVGLVLAVLIWVPSMESSLADRAGAVPLKVNFQWPAAGGERSGGATWVPTPVRDELLSRATIEMERHSDPFSPSGLKAISDSLMQTGWFDSPPNLRRVADAIHVDAQWRTPAAVVRREGVDYLISRNGHLLPVAYQRGQAPVPAIVGVAHEPPSSGGQVTPGAIWPGDDIPAALETLAVVSARPWWEQVAAVDISGYAAHKRIALISKWNGRAILGGGPRDIIPGEVSFEMKLRRLDELVRQFGQIDAKHRLVEVGGPVMLVDDVTHASRNP